MALAAAACIAALLLRGERVPERPAQAPGSIRWRGDYETGDFLQWEAVQASCRGGAYSRSDVGDSCASVVASPARQGRFAGKFVVRPLAGLRSTRLGGERAEVYVGEALSGGYEGQEWYYAWSTMFPAQGNVDGFSTETADFNVFTDWHNADGSCGGNVVLGIDAASTRDPRVYFLLARRDLADCTVVLGRRKYHVPLRYDHWYDFVIHVKWSSDPSRGFVEAWVDGQPWGTRLTGATMLNARGAYWKQGFYRAMWQGGTNTVVHDGARRGTTFESVSRPTELRADG